MSVLYISYDGILEPLGQSQVLAYLKHLSVGRRIHLISFEKADEWANVIHRRSLSRDIVSFGIIWHPLIYHKRPIALATALDIVNGVSLGLWLVLRYRLRILHARSYVSSVMALIIKRFTGIKYLFDMRGFWADEKLEAGWSRDGYMYKLAKRFERVFLLTADHVVSLTYKAVPIIEQLPYLQNQILPISVIPTCCDFTRFMPIPRDHEIDGLTIGYVGTASNWYLFDQTAACFAELLQIRPDSRFLIVNRGEHQYISMRLAAAKVPLEKVELVSADPSDMPRLISRMDASIFFIKPVFSKQASAATKLAELLGCGVPCLSNSGVGDMEEVLQGENVGVTVSSFDQASMVSGIYQLLQLVASPKSKARCIAAAHKYFSLDEGVRKYSIIYEHLDKPNHARRVNHDL